MLTEKKLKKLMTQFLTRSDDESHANGIARNEDIAPFLIQMLDLTPTAVAVARVRRRTRRISTLTTLTENVIAPPVELSDFGRRQLLRSALASVFDWDLNIVDRDLRSSVSALWTLMLEMGNTDEVHNGNKHLLKQILKMHPISNVEQMRFDEMKVVAQALLDRDEVTIETIVDIARRRRNG